METTNAKTESKITYSQAVLLARKLHSENKNPYYIARGLQEAGYIGRSGKALGGSGARHMALYGKARTYTGAKTKTKTAQRAPKTESVSDRDALLVLILESNLKPEAKIKAALGCLHGKGV